MNSELGKLPESLQEAVVYFSDIEKAHKWAVALRWPTGIECPRCGSKEHSFITTRHIWFCKGCKKQFTVKVGSIFEDSPLGMDKWMLAVWLLVTCKNGISSYEVASHLGITQKSAWHLMHRVRKAVQSGSFVKFSGECEVDETFIGGKARNMHIAERKRRITGTGGKDKTAVMGIMERGGKVRTVVVQNRKKKALQAEVRKHVEAGSALYSDALLSYNGLESEYAHQVIDHAVAYVDGNVHTNSLENFWSLLKRSISGTYISVEPFHLHRYLDEQAYRFNNREMSAAERFAEAMVCVNGKKLTWDHLTGKQADDQTCVN
jgi:transposase-like protein